MFISILRVKLLLRLTKAQRDFVSDKVAILYNRKVEKSQFPSRLLLLSLFMSLQVDELYLPE